jgi:hypothetical protein
MEKIVDPEMKLLLNNDKKTEQLLDTLLKESGF